MASVDRTDFSAWQAHPVTRWVLRGLELRANDLRDTWIERSWDGGDASPEALIELRTRADALLNVSRGTYEDFCAAVDEEPEAEESA